MELMASAKAAWASLRASLASSIIGRTVSKATFTSVADKAVSVAGLILAMASLAVWILVLATTNRALASVTLTLLVSNLVSRDSIRFANFSNRSAAALNR